jgi:hypothetical protein
MNMNSDREGSSGPVRGGPGSALRAVGFLWVRPFWLQFHNKLQNISLKNSFV